MSTETKTIYYGNASQKQREYIEAKIRQELGGCQSMLVSGALEKGFFQMEDIQNPFEPWMAGDRGTCEHCNDDKNILHCDYDCCENCWEQYEQSEHFQEIFEWWPIESSFLVEDLLKMGEPVLSNDYGDWWGRTCTGQSISLDPTFWDIFQEHIKTI